MQTLTSVCKGVKGATELATTLLDLLIVPAQLALPMTPLLRSA